jgi:hypothetical protein
MLTVLSVVAPVFAIVALGYSAVRFRLYPASGVPGLIAFVNNFATPFLLCRAMLSVDFESAFNPRIISAYYIAALFVFVTGIFVGRMIFRQRPGESVSTGFSFTYTNMVLIGLPIIERAYGLSATPVIFTIIGLHAPIVMTIGMLTMEVARRDGGSLMRAFGQGVLRALTNPLFIGIMVGLAGNFLGVDLPEPVDAFTLMMAQAVLPAALFGLGGGLNQYKLQENWAPALVGSFAKLIILPAAAWVLMVPVFGVDHDVARYAVVLAAMPAGLNVYVFATYFNRGVSLAANMVLISTVLSVVTVSSWLYLMTL